MHLFKRNIWQFRVCDAIILIEFGGCDVGVVEYWRTVYILSKMALSMHFVSFVTGSWQYHVDLTFISGIIPSHSFSTLTTLSVIVTNQVHVNLGAHFLICFVSAINWPLAVFCWQRLLLAGFFMFRVKLDHTVVTLPVPVNDNDRRTLPVQNCNPHNLHGVVAILTTTDSVITECWHWTSWNAGNVVVSSHAWIVSIVVVAMPCKIVLTSNILIQMLHANCHTISAVAHMWHDGSVDQVAMEYLHGSNGWIRSTEKSRSTVVSKSVGSSSSENALRYTTRSVISMAKDITTMVSIVTGAIPKNQIFMDCLDSD